MIDNLILYMQIRNKEQVNLTINNIMKNVEHEATELGYKNCTFYVQIKKKLEEIK